MLCNNCPALLSIVKVVMNYSFVVVCAAVLTF